VSKGTKYGMSVTTEISGECVQLALPVTINWEECKTSSGRKFLRANVENVGKVLQPLELKTPLDNCTLDKDTVKKAGWQTVTFSVPKATKQNQTLTVEQGQGAEISLQTTIAGAEIGPKAVVKNLKQAEYSYTLVGPHDYLAYLPKNRTTYCWNWS